MPNSPSTLARLYDACRAGAIALVVATMSACTWEESGPARAFDPGWRDASPESRGLDASVLADAVDWAREADGGLHSIVIVRHDRVVLRACFWPYDCQALHELASVTKSVTSTLLGIAEERGLVASEDRLTRWFPEHADMLEKTGKGNITLAHLAAMTAGFDCGKVPGELELRAMQASADWVQYALDLPVAAAPGAEWAYCSSATHLLAAALTRAVGGDLEDFAEESLFAPLGITTHEWPRDPQGIVRGYGDLRLGPDDLARLGAFWLGRGSWRGRQVLSSEWLTDAFTPRATTPSGDQYGLGFWIPSGAFSGTVQALGRGGQRAVMWPAKDVVVALNGAGSEAMLSELALRLSQALKSDGALPENPGAVARLNESLANAALAPSPGPVPALPQAGSDMSGHAYALDPNPLDVTGLRLTFDGTAQAELVLSTSVAKFPLALGLDGLFRFTDSSPTGQRLGLRGQWTSSNEFVSQWHEPAGSDRMQVTISVSGSEIVVAVDDLTNLFDATLTGQRMD